MGNVADSLWTTGNDLNSREFLSDLWRDDELFTSTGPGSGTRHGHAGLRRLPAEYATGGQ